MKKRFLFGILISLSILGHAIPKQLEELFGYKDTLFFLSTENIVQIKQASLENLCSFTFFPFIKVDEKNAGELTEFIDQELKLIGSVVKKPVLTPQGADLESFSNPTLQFTIEQLVDQNHKLLPVLQATLSINTIAELRRTKQSSSINISRWSTYLEITSDVQEVVKKTFPYLLSQFITDFKRANSNQKPIFYISYDAFWWKTKEESK